MTHQTAPTRAMHRVQRAASDLRWALRMAGSFPGPIRLDLAALTDDVHALAADMRGPARSLACVEAQRKRRVRAAERRRRDENIVSAVARMERAVEAALTRVA